LLLGCIEKHHGIRRISHSKREPENQPIHFVPLFVDECNMANVLRDKS
jgi:hypothetical protein